MSRKKLTIIAAVIFVCLLAGGLIYQGRRYMASNTGTVKAADLRPKDENEELGTPENPFTVLEIVPSREEAQIGYFIPGCEPVDMEKAKHTESVKGEFTSTLSSIYDISDVTEYAFYDQISAELGVPVYENDPLYQTRTDLTYISEYRNYGEWRKGWNPDYSQRGDWVAQPGGGFTKYSWGTDNYGYAGVGKGEYAWVPSEAGASVRKPNNDLFQYTYIEYKNKDLFIPAAFQGADSSSFESQVITLTPAELNTEENLKIIDVADLILIHGGSGNYSGMARIYNALNANGDHMDSIPNTPPSFWDSGRDLTYSEVMRITERMASDNPAALFLDKANMFASNHAQREYNVHKLLYMVLTFKPEVFWSTFENYLKPYTGADGTAKVEYTGGDMDADDIARRFWGETYSCDKWSYQGGAVYQTATNPFLFHPTSGACMIDDVRYYNINGGGYDIFDKIFTFHGDQTGLQALISGGKIEKKSMETDGLFANNCTSDAFVDDNEDAEFLTNIQAMEFILGRASYTPKLRILEIQPCDEFIYGSTGWKEYYQALFPWYHPKSKESSWLDDRSLITVTTMPTWEFIGSTGRYDYSAKDENGNVRTLMTESSDDLLAKYDLIIIGSNQDESNGGNGYNEYTDARDENRLELGNLIYTSIGGTWSNGAKTEKMNNAGLTEMMDIRHPGTDITLKKLLELQDFLRAGKPIVADDGLYGADKKVDPAKVDKSSKIYDLLTWNKAGSENIFVHDRISSTKMKRLISQNLCRLEFYEAGYPLEYDYAKTNQTYFIDPSDPGATATAEGVITKEISRNEYDANGNPILTFHFFIRGTAKDTYNVLLNLDLNGDGVFSGSLKERAEVDNMNAATGGGYTYDTSEMALALMIYDADGAYLGTTNAEGTGVKLKANTEYQARYKLASNQQGMIPWKLEVQSNTNKYRRSSAVDYTVVSGKSKVPIHVLQMNLQTDMKKDSSVVKGNYEHQDHTFTAFTADSIVVKDGEDYEAFDRRNPDGTPQLTTERLFADDGTGMNEYQRQTVAKFKTYIAPVQEFSVDIQYLFNSDWYQLFGTGETSGDAYEKALADWKDFLADYDMLVFGFVDGSLFTSNTVFAEGVKDFVAQGKSMILSHDTVIGSNDEEHYGDYNSWLRTASGQRRSYYNRKSDGTYEKSYTDVKATGKIISFASDYIKNNYMKYLDELNYAVDGETVEPRFYNTLVNEWPDNENYLEACAQATFKDGSLGATERVTKDGIINDLVWEHPFSRQTTFVKLTNNGQITTYPYKLGDVIEVLSTHTQYYQLDLEYQQYGDVNVWFNLSDMHDPDVQKYCQEKGITGTADQLKVNLYSAKDQDCRNSFYIYNKGNITYTGSGHGEGFFGQKNALMTDDEVKLFVNTMIAAYRQPESRPYAVIENADTTTSDGTGVLYLDYDGYQFDTETEDGSGTETAEAAINPVPLYGAGLSGSVKNGLDGRVVTIDGVVRVGIEFSIHDIASLSLLTDKKFYIRLSHEGRLMTADNVIVRKINRDSSGNVTESEVTQLGTADRPYYQVDASDAGVSYIMYVPYADVTEGDGVSKYTVGTYASYTKSGRAVTTTTSNTDAQVMLMPLFELN